ncbi:MAG: hypothetical protein ABSC48_18480 [Terracidiphilus sp.]|jgi:antitoxin component of MazEF toxin-antitoxin module
MTTRIVRVGELLAAEIPGRLAEQMALTAGQAVEWAMNGPNSISLVKRTVTDGLLEIESSIAKKNAEEEHLLDVRSRAEKGDPDAQQFLGIVSKDKVEAAKWLQLAANQGDRFSMQLLGHMLVNGDGVERNIADGYFWFLLSLSTYSLKSTRQERSQLNVGRRELQRIGNNLTEEERKRVEERCRGWLDAHELNNYFFSKVLDLNRTHT